MIPIETKRDAPVDLLNRQEIADRIMKILEVISDRKSSCTFALNGAWGTGKTFVLNMLMNQIWEYHSDRYIVFHYNCWQYDYYEEPLIAIVAAMLDSVDEENHLMPADLREKARAGMELAKPVLKKIAAEFVKNKIGVDLTDVVSVSKEYRDALENEEKKKAEARSFDEFYSFKKAIQQAQEEIRKLAEERTLVVVVDELDRCLPGYAIKVLERLHHLFAGLQNTAVILAVDKSQLDNTVLEIFGNSTNSTEYLRKFIDFKLELDNGIVESERIKTKYHDFFEQYCRFGVDWSFPCEDFISCLFDSVPIRTQERIFERMRIVHNMLFPNTKKDFSFICSELFWLVIHEYYGLNSNVPYYYKDTVDDSGVQGFRLLPQINNRLSEFFKHYWSAKYIFVTSQYSTDGVIYVLDGSGDIQLLLIYYLSHLYRTQFDENTIPLYNLYTEHNRETPILYRTNKADLLQAVSLLQVIQ